VESPFDSPYFEKAGALLKLWPTDKSIPAQLAEMYVESDGHPSVGIFFEALWAAAEGEEDLLLVMQASQSLPDE